MYTRWNDTNHWFEKDTSPNQDGSGPWVELSIDGSQIGQGIFDPARIPDLDASKITSGILPLVRGGTGADLSATGGSNQFLAQDAAHNISARSITLTDLPTIGSGNLADYTIGTWSPLLIDTSTGIQPAGTVTGSVGHYIRLGNLWFLQFTMGLSAKGTYNDQIAIGGFPRFVTGSVADAVAPLWFSNLAQNVCSMIMLTSPGFSYARLYAIPSVANNNWTAVVNSYINSSTSFIGSLTYIGG